MAGDWCYTYVLIHLWPFIDIFLGYSTVALNWMLTDGNQRFYNMKKQTTYENTMCIGATEVDKEPWQVTKSLPWSSDDGRRETGSVQPGMKDSYGNNTFLLVQMCSFCSLLHCFSVLGTSGALSYYYFIIIISLPLLSCAMKWVIIIYYKT